ncbi:MAG: adenylate/guanylate cyclase domain-containing protein [Deltaproteobacteria bacterium]|nr:adenylate/guanylate cyclase domain-containing protein [Deltaproteobacteria bacterium]MBW2074911.1 adenylate/guanylate cyclase domain-containing protein [Deltaproteobacteria bacterium]
MSARPSHKKNFLKRLFRVNAATITIGIIVLGVGVYLWGVPFLDLMELKTVDLRFLSRGPITPGSEVVLAVVDEKSLEEQGKWVWPRSKFAELVQILSDSGAKVIVFDVGFLEPDKNSTVEAITTFEHVVKSLGIRDDKLDAYLKQTKRQADNDLIFAEAIRRSKAKVVLGFFFQMTPEGLEHLDENIIKQQIKNARNARYSLIRYSSDQAQKVPLQEAFMPQSNIALIAQSSRYSGYFNMFPDRDGGVRWVPLVIRCQKHLYAPLAVQALRAYMGRTPSVVITDYGVQKIQIGKLTAPTNEFGRLMVNYRGGAKTFPHISITDILHHRILPETFKDKIVLVGATAIGIYDMRVTPFSSVFPGPEIHANLIDNILHQDFLQRPNWAAIFDLAAIGVIGLSLGLLLPRVRALTGMVVTIGLLVTYILVCQYLFTHKGAWLNIVYPVAVLVLMYVSLTVYKYLTEERDKKFLKATFESYLAPEIIEDMYNTKTMPELGGEARTITAYFTDIQGFSTFSEKLTAHQLVELLNEYLSAMTDILIAEKGTLDKYEGDAIIAFFGAPMDLPDHALRACRVAVAMQNKLAELREKWRNEKQSPDEPNRNTKNMPPDEWIPGDKWPKIVHKMKMRIGINSGEMVVGNMGSSMRMNYTMMGDPVNLAARLEAAGKQYGIYTMVSEYTLDLEFNENGETKRIRDMVEVRMIDNITVVGKSEPVKVYEVCAMKGELTDQEKELFKVFDEGMQHYLKMEWDEAIAKFNESLKIERITDGKTTPSEVYIQRCKAFKENPPVAPGEKWDGVFRLTKK